MSGRNALVLIILLSAAILAIPVSAGFSDVSVTPVTGRNDLQFKVSRNPPNLILHSSSVLVQDQTTGKWLVQKQADAILPIASITKLMTAMVTLDANLNLEESLTIVSEDVDTLRHSRSHLPVHNSLTRRSALLLSLMASENRAAHALGRTYPGGLPNFVAAMNAKALSLGLFETHFDDPTGISIGNTSSARDLARMAEAAFTYRLIREYTTSNEATVRLGHRTLRFRNTNKLVENPQWQIGLSKTGFLDEAGRCLVMQSQVANRSVVIVLLDAKSKEARYGDANRIKRWMESSQTVQKKHGV